MKELKGLQVRLWEGDMRRREEANKNYLMKLETRYLLRSSQTKHDYRRSVRAYTQN